MSRATITYTDDGGQLVSGLADDWRVIVRTLHQTQLIAEILWSDGAIDRMPSGRISEVCHLGDTGETLDHEPLERGYQVKSTRVQLAWETDCP